jgi:hypothetical protein
MSQQITNNHNLPEEVYRAIVKDRYTVEEELPSDYSATTLIAPIQQTILKRRYPDKLRVFDAIDMFWSFMWSIAHSVLEEAWHEGIGSRVEERLYANVGDKVLSGKLDCYANGMVRDYKTTKVYKVTKGDYEEWEKQLNVYAYLCRHNGYPVTELKVIAIIFNWSANETYKKGYPKCPIVEIPLTLWSDKEQDKFVMERIAALEDAKTRIDHTLPACSKREMWQDLKDYAVMKDGGTRALKCFDNEEEARAYRQLLNTKNKTHEYDVVARYTGRKRCYEYCPASTVCIQHKELMKEEGNGESNTEGDLLF